MRRFAPTRWPVKARLAGVSAALTLLILLCFALVVGRLAVNKLQANFREEAQSFANSVANRYEIKTDQLGRRLLGNRGAFLDELILPSDSSVVFVDANGTPADPDAPTYGPPDPAHPRDVGSATVATQQIPTSTLGPPVYVQYTRGHESLEATTDRLWLFLGLGVLGGTVLAALAGLAVARRAMRPISSLTAAAREVATTRDPSRRLPMPETNDEVAELAATLDEMLGELDAARSENEQMVQAQREFVADASHELRTPLTSILANLELLDARLEERGGDGEDREIVAGALGSSRRMRRLVSDLLLLARADAGRESARRRCNLTEIASAAIAELDSVSELHSIGLEADGPVEATANPDDIHRLVANLVENAVRHTPAGTNVVVSVAADGDDAVIEVADDGPGLPAGLGDQIFARFVRGSGPADRAAGTGTGLGLAIVKAVTTAHGGSVEAGTSDAGGARFTARLPRSAAERPAAWARAKVS